jgi:hypothetical protein
LHGTHYSGIARRVQITLWLARVFAVLGMLGLPSFAAALPLTARRIPADI